MSVCSDIRLRLLFNDLSTDKFEAMIDEWTNISLRKNTALEWTVFLLNSQILFLHIGATGEPKLWSQIYCLL